jgi:hypothetical protein
VILIGRPTSTQGILSTPPAARWGGSGDHNLNRSNNQLSRHWVENTLNQTLKNFKAGGNGISVETLIISLFLNMPMKADEIIQ